MFFFLNSASSCSEKHSEVLPLQKGTENGLKSARSPIQDQTTAVGVHLNYTFYVCVSLRERKNSTLSVSKLCGLFFHPYHKT